MHRRDFLKGGLQTGGAVVAGLAVSASTQAQTPTSSSATPPVPATPVKAIKPYRLPVGKSDAWLPKLPLSVETIAPSGPAIAPMSLEDRVRRHIVPRRGVCSLAPADKFKDTLLTGNGWMSAELAGDPFAERVVFRQERLLLPWKRPFEAPNIAAVLPEVRKLLLAGKYREGLNLSFQAMTDAGLPMNTKAHATIPAFTMSFDGPAAKPVRDYCRTLDFESGEARVMWRDDRGEWLRRTFVSRPDNIAVQVLTAPAGQTISTKISLKDPSLGAHIGPVTFEQHNTPDRLTFSGHFDPSVNNNGYAGVTRIVRNGGSARLEGDTLVIENATSVVLLTRIEWFADYSQKQVDALAKAVDAIEADPEKLLARHRAWQSPIFNRMSVDFGGAAQSAMSGEELLADQRTRADFSPALLEKIFDMGRYWLIIASGKYPPMSGEVNININLQIAHGVLGDLPEAMAAYFDWIESLLPDCRNNAKNIFGARGAVYPVLPNKEMGVSFHYAGTEGAGAWPHPYWTGAGGWVYSPFWDYYLVTGDMAFLRDRVVPGLKEIALFYEDFLTVTDERGNYVFVPSFSPENWPVDAEPLPADVWPLTVYDAYHMKPPCPLVINSTMDLMVCQQVLANLIDACETLGSDPDKIPVWKAMLAKMPPALTTRDGTLKEWSWPGLEENYDQRHVSHLYGAWPGDQVDPGRNPELARAALLADRKRGPANTSSHGLCHRALAGARLKDSYLVNFELRQLLEQGYFGNTLRSSHNPYNGPQPDSQGGVPAILLEMLSYSRPGVIELLPALPETLRRGRISGMRARTFARIDNLMWDIDARTMEARITSLRDQDITLVVWHGIADIQVEGASAEAVESHECRLHLPANRQVTVRLKLISDAALNWNEASV